MNHEEHEEMTSRIKSPKSMFPFICVRLVKCLDDSINTLDDPRLFGVYNNVIS